MYDHQTCRYKTTMDLRFAGNAVLGCPYAEKTTSQRLVMWSGVTTQWIVVHGAQHPQAFTSFETEWRKYTYDETYREHDGTVYETVPKFKTEGDFQIVNPETTVFYTYEENGDTYLDYFMVPLYTKLSEGFGYKNYQMNKQFLQQGSRIPKDMRFYQSGAEIKNNMYGMGVNARSAAVNFHNTVEDSFWITERLQEQLRHTVINRVSLSLNRSQVMLNIFGDDTEYKVIPDAGQSVGDEGALCAIRDLHDQTFFADINSQALQTIQEAHDKIIPKYPESTVVDISVFVDHKLAGELDLDNGIYSQLGRYYRQHQRYYDHIIEIYRRADAEGFKLTERTNTLFYRAMSLSNRNHLQGPNFGKSGRASKIQLCEKSAPIGFMRLEITLAYDRVPSIGDKVTGRFGDKGTIGDIVPTEHTLVDEYGIGCDFGFNPGGATNRLNHGLLYEMHVCRMCDIIQLRMRELSDDDAYDLLIEFMSDLCPPYAEDIQRRVGGDLARRANLLQFCRETMVMVSAIPFSEYYTEERMEYMREKWPMPETTLRYKKALNDGTVVDRTLRRKGSIGNKYLLLLCKFPKVKATSASAVTQFMTPIKLTKNSISKHERLFGFTPLRLGEDEVRQLCLAVGPEATFRIIAIAATSPKAFMIAQERLDTDPYPTRIDNFGISNAELRESNVIIAILHQIYGVDGIEMTRRAIETNAEELSFNQVVASGFRGDVMDDMEEVEYDEVSRDDEDDDEESTDE